MPKTFAYIQHHGLPSQKAHSVYITKVAEAASELVHKCYLVFPSYNLGSEKEIATTYALQEGKPYLKKIYTPDLRTIKVIPKKITEHVWYIFSSWIFAIKVYVWLRQAKIDIIQTGDREIILLCKLFGKPNNLKIIYDVHFDFSKNVYDRELEKNILSSTTKIIVNCRYLMNKFVKLGVKENKILFIPNGYDPRYSDHALNIPPVKKKKWLLGYVGRLEGMGYEKGVEEMIRIVARLIHLGLPVNGISVGGPTNLVTKYSNLVEKLGLKINKDFSFIDQISHSAIFEEIRKIDIAFLPYPDVFEFREVLSPMKAIEYMIMKKIIISSDLSSIRDIMSDKEAYFVNMKDGEEVANLIKNIIHNPKEAYKKAELAQKKAKQFSWKKRQEQIFLNI